MDPRQNGMDPQHWHKLYEGEKKANPDILAPPLSP
jgi:hypothetical protein